MTDPLTRQLARFVARLTPEDLPPAVADKAKTCLLHGVGIGLAGIAEPISAPALAMVRAAESLPAGGASVIGTDIRATPAGAAFANSVLLHARLQEDAYLTASHPGSTIVPAALAIAETTGAAGRDLLAALAAGYEVMAAAIGETIPLTTPRGFRATPLYGGFGAAAAAGKLLGLDEDQMTAAIAFAGTLTGGTTGAMDGGMGTMTTQCAWAARNGLLAAQLAAAGGIIGEGGLEAKGGFYSAFAGLSEAPPIADHLGREWRIHEVTLKRYPAAMFNQPVIHIALQIANGHPYRPAEIADVELAMADFEIRYPSNAMKERTENLSTPTLAAAQVLVDRRSPSSPDPRADPPSPAARDLLSKIRLIGGRPGLSPKLTVTLTSGAILSAETTNAADFRFSFAEDAAIVRSLIPRMPVDAATVERLIDACANLESLKDVQQLLPTSQPG